MELEHVIANLAADGGRQFFNVVFFEVNFLCFAFAVDLHVFGNSGNGGFFPSLLGQIVADDNFINVSFFGHFKYLPKNIQIRFLFRRFAFVFVISFFFVSLFFFARAHVNHIFGRPLDYGAIIIVFLLFHALKNFRYNRLFVQNRFGKNHIGFGKLLPFSCILRRFGGFFSQHGLADLALADFVGTVVGNGMKFNLLFGQIGTQRVFISFAFVQLLFFVGLFGRGFRRRIRRFGTAGTGLFGHVFLQ